MPASYCRHCHPYPPHHAENWVSDTLELTVFPFFEKLTSFLLERRDWEKYVTDVFAFLGVVKIEDDFDLKEIRPITAAFLESGRKRGLKFRAMKGPFGYLPYFRVSGGGGWREFDKLPQARSFKFDADDKWKVKTELRKLGLPTAEGRPFSWFSKNKATDFAQKIGYPVVVKPRRGSLSQHMFVVGNEDELARAVKTVLAYSPVFVAEKFVPRAELYRFTVIDFENIFAAKRTPANVLGDGRKTLRELVREAGLKEENADLEVLASQGLSFLSVIPKRRRVFLQRKAIVALGSKIEEIPTNKIHPEIVAACLGMARLSGLPIVGIDWLLINPRKAPREQTSAILELNSLPNIVMHTFVKRGVKENKVADAIADYVVKKYD